MKRTFLIVALAALAVGMSHGSASAGKGEGGISFSGDMRGRYEIFDFAEDATGSEKDTRGRIRYRLRLNGKAIINNRAQFHLRIGTGLTDNRSGNVTLGDPVDFGSNTIGVRRAYMVFTPCEDGALPGGKGHWAIHFGRVSNPLIWKNGPDKMLWDGDIALAGASTRFDIKLNDSATFFLNGGYYAIDENSKGRDPYLGAVQGGVIVAGESAKAGVRGTYHHMAELTGEFVQRGVDGTDGATKSGGNVADGLTGDINGGRLRVVETQAFASTNVYDVPVTVFGGFSRNMDAADSEMLPGVGKEDTACNIGVEGGDSKKWIKIGGAWFNIQANAFPSQFIDSDFLDGHTNRKGIMVYMKRRVMKDTDFGVQAFNSDAIETGDDLDDSVKNSKRFRLQVDAIYIF